ncbi:MAG: copper amine oxidase N-terminal domain-containing protein [Peptococcaceae bacterium]|nr:copper amine oxidase N-terminal domain-containing protein [Peptococcaceae bacterium]
MKKNCFLTVLSAFILALMTALPAFAGDNAGLNVNGDPVASPGLVLENGVAFIPADTFARFAGADINRVSADTITITENKTVLSLTVGKKEALLDNKPVAMPAAPVKSGEGVLIPLRFVSNAFNFEVGWNAENRQVALSRNEIRDGMTPSDLLAKSNQAVLDINTYSMAGNMKMAMDIQADGKKMGDAPLTMDTRIEGQIQNSPLQAYMKMSVAPAAKEELPAMAMETYMTEEKMYIKAPGQEWTVQDMPFPPEFLKQQQDIQSDPLKAVAQMKEMGMLSNFGNDITVDGQEYYVVNTFIDMNKFRQGYEKMMGQMLQSMPAIPGESSPEQMQKLMQKLMENIAIDYYCSAYINKKTLISDIIKLDLKMNMVVNPSELAQEIDTGQTVEEPQEKAPQEIKIHLDMQGEIKVGDLGKPFAAPDVSQAKEITVPAESGSVQ